MNRQDNPTRTTERQGSDNGSVRRYQPRVAGTGYGRSSGYALPRQYTTAEQKNRELFRLR
jgi:hypothetical protein